MVKNGGRYHEEWADVGGRILTGTSIGPTGDPLAEDVITCRDRITREVGEGGEGGGGGGIIGSRAREV